MKTTLLALALTLVSSQAFAGASNTMINCVSADKKISLTGNVPGDTAEFNLDLKLSNHGAQEFKLYSDLNQQTQQAETDATITVIDDLRNGVYTLESDAINQPDQGLGVIVRLWALPKTIKLHELGNRNLKSAFTARIQVYGGNAAADTTVSCTTDYEI